jgi:hypothetical protein
VTVCTDGQTKVTSASNDRLCMFTSSFLSCPPCADNALPACTNKHIGHGCVTFAMQHGHNTTLERVVEVTYQYPPEWCMQYRVCIESDTIIYSPCAILN